MEIIYVPRGFGKTITLMEMSAHTGIPIVVPHSSSVRYIVENAKELGFSIPKPILAHDLKNSNLPEETPIYIDDIDLAIGSLIGRKVEAVTLSGNLGNPLVNLLDK